jgi:hypothetical protein
MPLSAARRVRSPGVRAASLLAALAMLPPVAARAQEEIQVPPRCDTPAHHQLDFWVGEWQVFDSETKQLVAFDRVEKQYEGCVILEKLTFLTDMYRRPGLNVRLAGIAVNRFDGESWLQMWADNQWGAIVLRGKARAQGGMEFVTALPSRGRDVKLIYEPQPGGGLRIVQYVAPAASGKWVKFGDLSYRRNR